MAHSRPVPKPRRTPETHALAFEASLSETGNALTMTKDGDGRLVLSLPPESHALVSANIGRLMNRTFVVAVLETQETPA